MVLDGFPGQMYDGAQGDDLFADVLMKWNGPVQPRMMPLSKLPTLASQSSMHVVDMHCRKAIASAMQHVGPGTGRADLASLLNAERRQLLSTYAPRIAACRLGLATHAGNLASRHKTTFLCRQKSPTSQQGQELMACFDAIVIEVIQGRRQHRYRPFSTLAPAMTSGMPKQADHWAKWPFAPWLLQASHFASHIASHKSSNFPCECADK